MERKIFRWDAGFAFPAGNVFLVGWIGGIYP